MIVAARFNESKQSPCNVYVYGNGDINGAAIKMLLIPRIMRNWDKVLQEITDKISLRTGQAVRKLYTLQGEIVSSADELQDGRHYVAVGYERFKHLPYGERARHHTLMHSPRRPQVSLPPIRRNIRTLPSKTTDANQSYVQKHAKRRQMEEQRMQPHTTPGAVKQQPRRLRPIQKTGPPPPSSDSDSVFHAKPVKVKRSGASGRLTQVTPAVDKEDDIFHAKGGTVKAEEVPDDEDTRVDLPIDQVPADTVEDEDILDVPVHREGEPFRQRTPSPETVVSPVKQADFEELEPSRTPTSPSRDEPKPSAGIDETEDFLKPNGNLNPPNSAPEEEEDKRFDTENKAATRIQARYRGYRVRADTQKKKKAQEDSEKNRSASPESVIQIQKEEELEIGGTIPQNLPLLTAAENAEQIVEKASEIDGYRDESADEHRPGTRDHDRQPTPSASEELRSIDGDQTEVNVPKADEDISHVQGDVGNDDNLNVLSSEANAGIDETDDNEDGAHVVPVNQEEAIVGQLSDEKNDDTGDTPVVEENDISEVRKLQGDPSEVNEPVFDMSSGQALTYPKPTTPNDIPDNSTDDQQRMQEHGSAGLPERDSGDGIDTAEGRTSEVPSTAADENKILENGAAGESQEQSTTAAENSQDSSPARPASQTSSVREKRDEIVEKSPREEQPIPNGQPASLLEGEA